VSEWIEQLDKLVKDNGLRFTFSINCHSGIASLLGPDHKCGCKRCLTERGEPWDDTTEAQAAADSKLAQVKMREWARSMYEAKL
jgi:hypothetical protein